MVLPARDAVATLAHALESVRRQSLATFECIVIDDGSRDGTLQAALAFQAADARFRVLERPRRGLVAALNDGVLAARARWVARMDADDLMLRRRLELQLDRLVRQSELCGVGCHVRMFPRGDLSDGRRQYERWLNSIKDEQDVARERFVECPLAHPTWLVRTEELAKVLYRDNGAAEDYDVLLRMLGAGARWGVVPQRLLLWRDHPERASRVDPRYTQERFTWLKALHLSESFLAGRESYTLWGYGATGKALCRELGRRGHRPSHIVEVHPGRLGQTIQGARVVEPDELTTLRGRPLVVSVAGERARREIREALSALGFHESVDFVCAA